MVWLDHLLLRGTRILINGRIIGWVAGQDFNAALLSVWLGDKPVTKSLKNELSGQ